ncbi:hypothetical protein [Xenophilus sp.]|uniref:hypothetical protein n=1 Tax=Xenophilus sp. TaxID=1873499 RepID=UPI0037DD6418
MRFWFVTAALLVAALCYLPGLAGPLVLDDIANLEPLIRWMRGTIGTAEVIFGNASGQFGRSISMASFLANAATSGDSVFAMKLTNLAIHLANGACVFALFKALARATARDEAPPARWLPAVAAAAWLLHPLLVSTVLYVVQRMALLSAFFMLLGMLAYLHGRFALRDGDRKRATALLALTVPACTVLAALSKENGVLVPALCGVLEWFAFAPAAGARRTRPSSAFVLATLALPALVALGLVLAGEPHVVGGYANRSFTLTERLLTQPRALWDYVGAFLMPIGPRLGLYHDDFPISHGLLDPPGTLVAILGWAAAIVLAWRVRRTIPAVPIGLGIFLVGQALESSVFPLLMYFEHRVYLPTAGLAWALAGLIAHATRGLPDRVENGARLLGLVCAAILAVLAFATFARATVWRSQATILAQALTTHPDSRWLRMDLIAQAMAQQPPRREEALAHAEHLLQRPDPLDRRFGALMALSIECLGDAPVERERIVQVFGGAPRAIEPDLLVGYEQFAERNLQKPCPGFPPAANAAAMAAMLDRVQLPAGDRSVWRLRFKAAKLLWFAGDPQAALAQAKLAYAPGTSDPAVGMMIVGLLLQLGNQAEARSFLDRAALRIPITDVAGQRLVSQYRAQLAQGHSSH